MRKDLTDITVVMDRSGSMASRKEEAENGINSFVKEQAALPGDALFTLVQFDDQYEFVHTAVPIKRIVPAISLVPRGWTALLDAVGKAITETGERLGKMKEEDRPGLVVFVIVTDGLENKSQEYTLPRIKQMIQHQTDVYKWQFTYIGANQDAFAAGASMGIPTAAIADYAEEKTSGAFLAASGNVGRMRGMSARGQTVNNCYSAAERKSLESDAKK